MRRNRRDGVAIRRAFGDDIAAERTLFTCVLPAVSTMPAPAPPVKTQAGCGRLRATISASATGPPGTRVTRPLASAAAKTADVGAAVPMVMSIGCSMANEATSAQAIFRSAPDALKTSVPPASEVATPVMRSPFLSALRRRRLDGQRAAEEAEAGERSGHGVQNSIPPAVSR
jgi:hypothetical protein